MGANVSIVELEIVACNTNLSSDGSNLAHPSCLSMSTVATKSFEYDAKIVKKWLHCCVSSHTECRAYQKRTTDSAQRPTRVLHIDGDHVKLRCDISTSDV